MTARSLPDLLPGSLAIEPWPDDVIDALGHDPRSQYVEIYWLGILGPSSMVGYPYRARRHLHPDKP